MPDRRHSNKSFDLDFEQFFERPTRETFKQLIRRHTGEGNALDFKLSWPADDKKSWAEIIKDILAIANTGGGCIILGVDEHKPAEESAVGLESILDKAKVKDKFQPYLPAALLLRCDILDFTYSSQHETLSGKCFQVVIIDDLPRLIPFLPTKESGQLMLSHIYVRRGTSSELATHDTLQELIARRVSSEVAGRLDTNLSVELEELRSLYGQISPTYEWFDDDNYDYPGPINWEDNRNYPRQSLDEFIAEMIRNKKQRIANLLRVEHGAEAQVGDEGAEQADAELG